MTTRPDARRLEPADQVGGVHVREVTFDDVKEALVDTSIEDLLASVVCEGASYEVGLGSIDLGLVPFRARVYRYARGRGLVSHVFKIGRRGAVRIHSHSTDTRCDLCLLTRRSTD